MNARLLLFMIICRSTLAFGQDIPSAVGDFFYVSEARRHIALKNALAQPPVDNNIDVTYYKLDLTVATDPNYLRGVVTVNAVCVGSSLSQVTLDLMNSMVVDSIRVESVSVGFVQQPSTVVITLNRTYAVGELLSLEIAYHGLPATTGFGSFVFTTHSGVPWIWSLSEPYGARDWWPCKDHPSDKADSVDIRITCRDDFKVGSNGRLAGVIDNGNGTKTWEWAERYPIATYLVSIAITNYVEFSNWFYYSPTDSMQVLNFVLPEHLDHGLANLPRAVRMLEIFSGLFGLYPFINEKYGHAEFGWGGAMEHQTMTSATYNAFAEYVVAHELAHQWFGDLITCANWPNIWMNEGFATYCEALYFEQQYGTDRYWQDMTMKMATAKTAVGTIHVQDTSGTSTLFNSALVYRKGASVLHMLRHVLGDSVFFAAMKSYATDPRFQFGIATTDDFREVCETVSGSDLGYFFTQWIHGEKYPQYGYSWYSSPAGSGHDVTVRVYQSTGTSNPAFFTMPVDVRLGNGVADTTVTVFHTYSGQEFIIHLPFLATQCELDPENWILRDAMQIPVYAEEPLVPGATVLGQNYPNPFNPSTLIAFDLSRGGHAKLVVHDILGRVVTTLIDDVLESGRHQVLFAADGLSGGVYFYTLEAGEANLVRKMILLR